LELSGTGVIIRALVLHKSVNKTTQLSNVSDSSWGLKTSITIFLAITYLFWYSRLLMAFHQDLQLARESLTTQDRKKK
jgi:hypothetical protein